MNPTSIQLTSIAENPFAVLVHALRDYLVACEELLGLMTAENTALRGTGEYQPFQFHHSRKGLLARLDESLKVFRRCAPVWRQAGLAERSVNPEVKPLLNRAQEIAVKVLVLDRENQQALLRRGLYPARDIPSAAGHRPHFVANVYQRNSVAASKPTVAESPS